GAGRRGRTRAWSAAGVEALGPTAGAREPGPALGGPTAGRVPARGPAGPRRNERERSFEHPDRGVAERLPYLKTDERRQRKADRGRGAEGPHVRATQVGRR